MSKFRRDLRIAVLGATAAIFSVSVFLLTDRIDSHYTYLRCLRESAYSDVCHVTHGLWWLPILLAQISLSVIATLVAHRYLAARLKSPFLLWQVIGAGSLLAWLIAACIGYAFDWLQYGNLETLMYSMRTIDFGAVAKYTAAVLACHVLFASLINTSVKEYAEEFEPQRH